ncbi:site-specific integrase [Endozoicomonas gorgoniicola]|uniref:Site-specific integrase n=1 Tax=Endozoicomonas gorgoniicola TaxID=1234144 RepID=A0ABT3MU44_9GAMM|nr:site-specific integrase [Endozoicomonas gorgoniicola]MCW7552905.1 site-specific integrase [Endozoicomonas gorgoniicola]
MTLDNYRYYANRFIKPEFGHLTIPEFRVGHITQWVTRMGNKHISNTTLKSYLSPLRSAFRYAKSQNLVEYNPFIDFEWPEESRQTLQKKRARKKQKKLDVFTLEEISGLLAAGQRPQETHIIQFGFWSGLRPEELFALHWEDIDFNRGIACISRAKVFRRGYTMIEETPEEREVLKEIKTGELGERDLILLPSALSALKRQQPYTHTYSPFVFHADYNNKPWRNTNQFRNRFQKLCLLAGVRYRRPYMMRHTYASMLLKEGENENFVARQLGHVDTQMLRKVYGEFIPDRGTDNGYQLRGDWQAIEELHAPALPAPNPG